MNVVQKENHKEQNFMIFSPMRPMKKHVLKEWMRSGNLAVCLHLLSCLLSLLYLQCIACINIEMVTHFPCYVYLYVFMAGQITTFSIYDYTP